VVQSSRIVCPHAKRESYSRHHVKKSPLTYVLINKHDVLKSYRVGAAGVTTTRSIFSPNPCERPYDPSCRNIACAGSENSFYSLHRSSGCDACPGADHGIRRRTGQRRNERRQLDPRTWLLRSKTKVANVAGNVGT
jgi:hypothetical protein